MLPQCLEILTMLLYYPPFYNRSLSPDPPFRPLTPDSELRLFFLESAATPLSLPMTQPNLSLPLSHLSSNFLYSEATHNGTQLMSISEK